MVNIVVLQGRLVYDPDLRYTQSGKAVTSVRIAWSEKINEQENKLFLDCTFWGKTAEFAKKFFKKGQEAIVTGKLVTNQWTDAEGIRRQKSQLVGQIGFCGSKQQRSYDHNGCYSEKFDESAAQMEPDPFSALVENDEPLPF